MTAMTEAKPDYAAKVSPWVEWAGSLKIDNPTAYATAADSLKYVKALQKEIENSYGPLKKKASEAHKAIVAEEKRQLAPLLRAETVCKAAMLNYQREEDAKRMAEQRKLQAEADERARREREALEKKAAAAKKPETQQRYQEQAAAVVAPVVAVASQAPKLEGVSTRRTWKAQVVDTAAFMAFVFANKRADLVLPNEKMLDALAKGLKEAANIPGVKFFEQETLASRS